MYPEFSRGAPSYGMNYIIRKYVNWPDEEPLPICITHTRGGVDEVKNSLLQKYWCINEEDFKIKSPYGNPKNFFCLGYPPIYMNDIPVPKIREGTLAVPAHGYGDFEENLNINEYCDNILSLPDEFHPITVRLHYGDRHLGQEIKKRGIDYFVTEEPIDYSTFFYNMREQIHRHKYLTTNYGGEHLWLAVLFGALPFYYGAYPKIHIKRLNTFHKVPIHYEQYFSLENVDKLLDLKRRISNERLGMKHKKKPRELIQILDGCKQDKQYRNLYRMYERFGIEICDILKESF